VSLPTTKATEIASMLAQALGTTRDDNDPHAVRIEESDATTRVQVLVPSSLSEPDRLKLLAGILQTGLSFGQRVQSGGESVLWVEIDHTDSQDGGRP
jgi:hypothetical protein